MAIRTSDRGLRTGATRAGRRAVGARGFSLPEVLAALSILGISVLGVQGLLLGLSRAAGTNAHYAVATELAQAELEDLRSLRYGEVTSRSSSATVGGLPFSIDSVVTEGVPQPETKHIHTTVSWVSQGGMGQQFSLETIYAEIRP